MENRSRATLELARELVDDVELARLGSEETLLKGLRLARLIDDQAALKWLRFELNGYPNTEEARKWMRRFGRLTDENANLGYWIPLAGVIGSVAAMQAQIQTLKVPDVHFAPSSANPHELVGGWGGMTAATIVAPANSVLARLQALTTAVSTLSSIRSRVLAAVHEFAVSHYHALAFENLAEGIFEAHRSSVDRLLALNAPEVLEKLPSISDRLGAGDPEAVSQAMNSVRRMVKALADHLCPPAAEAVEIEGQRYEVGSDKVLNRLKVFLSRNCESKSRRDRLNRTVRDLYERASAGAHTDITRAEARALLLAVYLALGEIAECGSLVQHADTVQPVVVPADR